MKIRRTRPDPTRDYEYERATNGGRLHYPATYANAESHWWDASQIYGSNHQTTLRLRAEYRVENGKKIIPTRSLLPDGKLYLDHDNLILDPNAIAPDDLELRRINPDWDGDRVFHTARMINSALMAKIHTVGMDAGHPFASRTGNRHERELVGAADRAPAPRDRSHQRTRRSAAFRYRASITTGLITA